MPFYIVHVCGRAAGRRASVDPEAFERAELAEAMARARCPEQPCLVVEAEDPPSAVGRAIGASRALDDLAT